MYYYFISTILINVLVAPIFAAITVEDISVVPCVGKSVCVDAKNLQINIKVTAPETSEGVGETNGIISSGYTFWDGSGNWELTESINVALNYSNALWEFDLNELHTFWTLKEHPCWGGCSEYANHVACANQPLELALLNDGELTAIEIDAVETWIGDLTISTSSNSIVQSTSMTNTVNERTFPDVHITASVVFDTTSCFNNLPNDYYVVKKSESATDSHYFIKKTYFQDARNNLNLSVSTWERDFDCNWTYIGWHVVIPFYETDAEYSAQGLSKTGAVNDQLYLWVQGEEESSFVDVLNVVDDGCSDLTNYPGSGSVPLEYSATKIGMVDYFNITLEFNYTQVASFIQTASPTDSPSPSPTSSPTTEPTPSPTDTPTPSPTSSPTTEPTKSPTDEPTPSPTPSPSSSPVQPPTNAPSDLPTPQPSASPSDEPTIQPTTQPSEAPTINFDGHTSFETHGNLEITGITPQDVDSSKEDIIMNVLSNVLSVTVQYIQLNKIGLPDSSRRRLLTNEVIIDFTVYSLNEVAKDSMTQLLQTSSTYHDISTNLITQIPEITQLYVNVVSGTCGEGYKSTTISGETSCRSICNYNEYYDYDNSECKTQDIYNIAGINIPDATDSELRTTNFFIGMALSPVAVIVFLILYRCFKTNPNYDNNNNINKNDLASRKYMQEVVSSNVLPSSPLSRNVQPLQQTQSSKHEKKHHHKQPRRSETQETQERSETGSYSYSSSDSHDSHGSSESESMSHTHTNTSYGSQDSD